MKTKKFLALVLALVMAFSLVVPVSAAPTSVEKLTHSGTDVHDTARLTVYADDFAAAVGSIDSAMKAKLVLNYHDYRGNSTVTVAGQTESHANLTTFTLNGNSDSGIEFTNENSIETYFPGLNRLTNSTGYAIQFVDELGTSSQSWNYTFRKATDTDCVTLEVVPGNSDDADDCWQDLKDEAFEETHDNTEDSFIKLAAGSYLQMYTEKLTVNSDLKLDDFSNSDSVDANVTNAKAKLTYTNNSTAAYQLLLKKGTQFSLGCSIAEVTQDLLVTMSNVTNDYNASILYNVYNKLDKSTEEDLAKNLLVVFSEIAGLARPFDGNKPVVITFGTPTTSTNSSNTTPIENGTQTVETTTTTIVTNNEVGTTNTTTVSTETVTNESTVNDVTTKEVISTVTETSSTVEEVASGNENELAYTVTNSQTTTTTTTTFVDGVLQEGGTRQTDSLPVAVKNVTVSTDQEDSIKNLSTIGATAKVATPALNSVSEEALAAIVTEAVTTAQTDQSVDSISVKIVVEAEATTGDNADMKKYEVTPKAYTYVNASPDPTSEEIIITNANLATDAEFSVTLPVPDAMAEAAVENKVKVTHISTDYNNDTFLAEVLGSTGGYYVTFNVTHFSEFDLEPVTVKTHSTVQVSANLTLQDDIAINFHVSNLTKSASYYSVHYSFEEDEKVVQLSSIKPVNGEYSITVANCAARQMTDEVNFKLYCGTEEVFSIPYSIRQYCLSKIGGDDTKLANLCNAVLNYGANAQSYFDYKINCLANDGAGIDTSIPESVPEAYNHITVNVPSAIRPSANMTLVSKTEMNFRLDNLNTTYFENVVVRDLTTNETIDDSRVDVVEGADYYIVTVKGIPAKYLNHVFELSYQYWGDLETIQYSPMTYAYRNQTKPIHDLGKLCRALYGYWNAAKEYLPDD